MVHLEGGRTKVRDREGSGQGHPGLVSCDVASVPIGAESGPGVWSEYPGRFVAEGLGGAQGDAPGCRSSQTRDKGGPGWGRTVSEDGEKRAGPVRILLIG